MVWDLEFKRFKTREIREEMRQQYDNLKHRLALLEEKIKSEKEKPTMEAGDIARLDDDKVRLERDIDRLLNGKADDPSLVCIKGLDLELEGSKPTVDYPQGVQGVAQQLDALRELKGLLTDYIKQI